MTKISSRVVFYICDVWKLLCCCCSCWYCFVTLVTCGWSSTASVAFAVCCYYHCCCCVLSCRLAYIDSTGYASQYIWCIRVPLVFTYNFHRFHMAQWFEYMSLRVSLVMLDIMDDVRSSMYCVWYPFCIFDMSMRHRRFFCECAYLGLGHPWGLATHRRHRFASPTTLIDGGGPTFAVGLSWYY